MDTLITGTKIIAPRYYQIPHDKIEAKQAMEPISISTGIGPVTGFNIINLEEGSTVKITGNANPGVTWDKLYASRMNAEQKTLKMSVNGQEGIVVNAHITPSGILSVDPAVINTNIPVANVSGHTFIVAIASLDYPNEIENNWENVAPPSNNNFIFRRITSWVHNGETMSGFRVLNYTYEELLSALNSASVVIDHSKEVIVGIYEFNPSEAIRNEFESFYLYQTSVISIVPYYYIWPPRVSFDASMLSLLKHHDVQIESILQDIGKLVDTNKLSDNAVTTQKIANNAVTSPKIADGTVVTTKIADKSITTAKVADGAISTTKVADGTVTTAKVSDGAITTQKIADEAISTAKIDDDAITTLKIANNVVSTAKIIDKAVTTIKIADNAVTDEKLGNELSGGKLKDGSVPLSKINGVIRVKQYLFLARVRFPNLAANADINFMAVVVSNNVWSFNTPFYITTNTSNISTIGIGQSDEIYGVAMANTFKHITNYSGTGGSNFIPLLGTITKPETKNFAVSIAFRVAATTGIETILTTNDTANLIINGNYYPGTRVTSSASKTTYITITAKYTWDLSESVFNDMNGAEVEFYFP